MSNPTTKEARILIHINPRTRCTIYLQSGAGPLGCVVGMSEKWWPRRVRAAALRSDERRHKYRIEKVEALLPCAGRYEPLDQVAGLSSQEIRKINDSRHQLGVGDAQDPANAERRQKHMQTMEIAVVAHRRWRGLKATHKSGKRARGFVSRLASE